MPDADVQFHANSREVLANAHADWCSANSSSGLKARSQRTICVGANVVLIFRKIQIARFV
jgi:hypothetical protein